MVSTNLMKADVSKLKYNGHSKPNQYGINYFLEYDGGAPVFALSNGTVLQAPTIQINEEVVAPRLKVSFDEETIKKCDELYNRVLEIIKEQKWIPDDSLSVEDLKKYIKYPYDTDSYTYTNKETGEVVPVEHPQHIQFEFQFEDRDAKDKLKEYDGQLLEDENKTKHNLSKVEDLRTFLPKKSTCRVIFKLNRIYIAKSKKKDPKYFGNYNHVPHLVRRTSQVTSKQDQPASFSDDEDDEPDVAAGGAGQEHWDDLGVELDKDPEDDF